MLPDLRHDGAGVGNQLIAAGAHLVQCRSVLVVGGEIRKLVRIVLEIVKKLEGRLSSAFHVLTSVDPTGVAHAFPAGNGSRNSNELAEEVVSPIRDRVVA